MTKTKRRYFKFSIVFVLIVFMFTSVTYGQMKEYDYKRELINVSDKWHSIELPNTIFDKASTSLSDLRVYGITAKNDTIEAPYILRSNIDRFEKTNFIFKPINNSYTKNGYYYTFEIPSKKEINQIDLDFNSTNFDWKLKLEGSHNQKEWFTIRDNYRVVSIKNNLVDYRFTKLTFANSKYSFYRLLVKSIKNPKLKIAQLNFSTIRRGKFRRYTLAKVSQSVDKQRKQTVVEIELDTLVPMSSLKAIIADSIDYYRPFKLEYVSNRYKTEKGWKEDYSFITDGVLNSVDNNEINFNSISAKKLKLTIDNHDNKPLSISSFKCKGPIYELIVRFDEKAKYFLAYGNKKGSNPSYDITRFPEKIPANANSLQLGKEIAIEKKEIVKTEALFMNKTWLWIIMLVIIAVLTVFSLKMMRNK